jgi:hypothetical protein
MKLYRNISYDGYGDDVFLASDSKKTNKYGDDHDEYSETLYGELLPSSLNYMITKYLDKISQTDVVYDLGSGVGKIVVQFAFETPAKKCVGIELGLKKYQSSLEALNNIQKKKNKNLLDKISFIHGDIMKVSWTGATVLYINAFVFSGDIMTYIENKIIDINNSNRRNSTSVIKYIMLFGQRFSPDFLAQQGYHHLVVLAPQSFSDDSMCELYIHNSLG